MSPCGIQLLYLFSTSSLELLSPSSEDGRRQPNRTGVLSNGTQPSARLWGMGKTPNLSSTGLFQSCWTSTATWNGGAYSSYPHTTPAPTSAAEVSKSISGTDALTTVGCSAEGPAATLPPALPLSSPHLLLPSSTALPYKPRSRFSLLMVPIIAHYSGWNRDARNNKPAAGSQLATTLICSNPPSQLHFIPLLRHLDRTQPHAWAV